jgi:hypothetical protein
MKKTTYLLLLLCCFLTIQIQAQISIGVKGGYTNAWENYGEIELPEDAQIDVEGFNVTLITQYQLSKRFHIQLEPGITRRGAACFPGWNFPSPIFLDNDWHLTYAELPLIATYSQPIIPNSLEVVGRLGGGAAYLVKGVEIFESDSPNPIVTTITEDLKRFDYGVHTGLGVKKHFGKHQIIVDADFYLAFKDVDPNFASKNRSIDVSIGYLYSL